MRRFDIHTDEVVARTRARLATLMRRPRAPAFHRLAGLMPGAAAQIDPGEAAAFEEAAREAFRAGTTPKVRKPFTVVPTAEPPASMSGAVRPVASIAVAPAPAIAPQDEPSRDPTDAGRPAQPQRRRAGDTAPDFLLRTPTSVDVVADDFFDGLTRRVEGDR